MNTMRWIGWLLSAVLFFSFLPYECPAMDFSGESKTYLRSKKTPFEDKLLQLYEYLDINAEGIGGKDISFYASGWIRFDLADKSTDDRNEQDLNYAYLSFFLKAVNTKVRLGRLYVFEGVASEQIDGLYLKSDIPGGFDLSAFAGSPVELDFDDRRGDIVYGLRASRIGGNIYQIGVSYLREDNDGDIFREEAGVDFWLHPSEWLDLQGLSSYNLDKSGWMEHTYHLTLNPVKKKLRMRGEFSYIDYEKFFSSALSGAFDPFRLNPLETVGIVGAGGDVFLNGDFTVSADYKKYNYEVAGSADFYGAALKYAGKDGWAAGTSVHRMSGQSNELKYYQYRAFVSKKIKKADITADFFDVSYDDKVDDIKHAYSVSAALGYRPGPKARISADIEYSKNPYFSHEVRALLKFIYRFGKVKDA
jgi:hypothetical protein